MTESEVEQWDRIQAEMLENLREQVRLGVLTPDQFPRAWAAVTTRIREHREQAELRDLWRWADSLEASGNERDAAFAIFIRQAIMEKRREQGHFDPP
jgi:hypothetical protein